MEITLKHYGNSRTRPSTIIELIVESNGNALVEDITNSNGFINESLIQDLKQIVYELETQNDLLNQKQ